MIRGMLVTRHSFEFLQRNGNVSKNLSILRRNFQLGKCNYPRRTIRASLETDEETSESTREMESSPWRTYVNKSLKNDSLESHITTSFGQIRIDSENTPKYHGQQDRYDMEEAENSGDTSNFLMKDIDSAEPDGLFGTSSKVFLPQSNTSSELKFEHSEYYKEESNDFNPNLIQFGLSSEKGNENNKRAENVNTVFKTISKSSIEVPEKSTYGFLDEHYFGEILHDKGNYSHSKLDQTRINQTINNDRMNDIDEQYFPKLETNSSIADQHYAGLQNAKESDPMKQLRPKDIINGKNDKLNIIDEQMFGGDESSILKTNTLHLPKKKSDKPKNLKKIAHEKKSTALDYVNKMRKTFRFDLQANSFVPIKTREQEISRIGESLQSRMCKAAIANRIEEAKEKEGDQDNTSPIENVGGRVDPKFLPTDLERLTTVEVENILKNSIVYDDNDIVALHKPYGLQMFGEAKNNRHSVDSLLSCLHDQLHIVKTDDWPGLMPVHRLDKNTTGILLCAKTKEMHKLLTNLFRQRKIIKKYWAILNGTPDTEQAIIDIPLGNIVLKGRHRLTLRPDYSNSNVTNKKKDRCDILPAVTEYSVLKTKGNASLVEAKPTTGFKHQIRVHMGLGLGTPVLGDHKYSRIAEFEKPQTVHGDILRRLEVRKSRSRDLPLCLHAKQILIPDIVEGRHVSIDCNLPHFFVKIMKRLNLKPTKFVR